MVLGNLCNFESEPLASASSPEIEALNMGEDLLILEHLVLDASVHLDARADAFHVSVLRGDGGELRLERTSPTFGAAVRTFDDALLGIWELDIPWRTNDTTYQIESGKPAGAEAGEATWVLTGGWTVLLDHFSAGKEPPALAESEPTQLLFAATSSHRSIAAYRILRAGEHAPYVALLWADPVGALYERVFFKEPGDLAGWLRARLRQDALPRRRKRK
ncbi:MAG: hypothetical protein ACMG6S_28760 [Byssovorax sp.]